MTDLAHPIDASTCVSIIVPMCDRCAEGERCLAALARQTWPSVEIVIVDDGSRDGTAEMLDRFVAEHPDLRVVVLHNERNMGANASRNRAIRASSGEFIAFLDSDCIAEPTWIERLLAGFEHDGVAAVTGLVIDTEPKNIYDLTYLGTHRVASEAGPARRIVAGNLCLRRQPLLDSMWCENGSLPPRKSTGQPDTAFSGACDEEGLHLRLQAAGHELMARPDAVVTHDHHYTRRSFFRQAYHGGRAAADLVYRYHLPQRLDMLPFIAGYVTLALALAMMYWTGPLVLLVPAFFLSGGVAAIVYNDVAYKKKTVGQTLRSFPVLLAYYHVRLCGYVAKTLRLRLRLDRVGRFDLRPMARSRAAHAEMAHH